MCHLYVLFTILVIFLIFIQVQCEILEGVQFTYMCVLF